MVVGVNSTAVLGEHEGNKICGRSCLDRLTIRFNEGVVAACHDTMTNEGAGPLLIAGARPRITLQRAVQIAALALREHEDGAGQPRILQALGVMNACATEDERIVAVLHPVVERGQCTLEALGWEGLPEDLIEAVDALVRRPGETDGQSTARAVCQPIARAVMCATWYDISSRVSSERMVERHWVTQPMRPLLMFINRLEPMWRRDAASARAESRRLACRLWPGAGPTFCGVAASRSQGDAAVRIADGSPR